MPEEIWTLTAKVDTFIVGGHLYWEARNELGNLVVQLNAVGTNSAGIPQTLGSDNNQLRIYSNWWSIPGTTQPWIAGDVDDQLLVFTGTKTEISAAISKVYSYALFINANYATIPYTALGGDLGSSGYNSNSGFAAIGNIFSDNLTIDPTKITDAYKLGSALFGRPGTSNDDLIPNITWSALVALIQSLMLRQRRRQLLTCP